MLFIKLKGAPSVIFILSNQCLKNEMFGFGFSVLFDIYFQRYCPLCVYATAKATYSVKY